MSTTTRGARSRRPPLDRDQAMLPLTQRPVNARGTGENNPADAGSSTLDTAAGGIPHGSVSNAASSSLADGGPATDMAMAAQSGQVEDDVRADGHGSVTNASSNSSADGGPATDIATAAQSEQVEDSVRADEQSVPNLIDLTGDEPMNGTELDVDGFHFDPDDENHAAICAEDFVVAKPIELSNYVFKCLLDMLNSRGVVYTSPKGKGREVASVTAASPLSDNPMGGRADSKMDPASTLPSMTPDLPLSSEHPMTKEGDFKIDPALLVSVHRPGLGYGHAIFWAKKTLEAGVYKPLTALYFYDMLRCSDDPQLDDVNRLVDRMSHGLIKLATASSPVFMDQKLLYGHPISGFRRLGHLEPLTKRDTMIEQVLEPVRDSQEKRRLLSINRLDETLDMYVLYIWTDDHTASSSMTLARGTGNAMASASASSQDDDIFPEEYQRYFQTLVVQRQNRDTTFSMFMHVRIVTEICTKLGIPCMHGVRIDERHMVGDRFLCVSDIIEKLGHRKPGTFGNHRGWVQLARHCLEHLEAYGCGDSEKKFMQQAKELLRTPLDAAHTLKPSRYGNMKEFNNHVKVIAHRVGIKRKKADTKDFSSESE